MNKFVLATSWWGDNDDQAKAALKFLTKHSEMLHYQDLWSFIFAKCKWGIVRFFYTINEWLANLMPKVFDLKGLLHNAGFTDLKSAIISGGLVAALMGLFLTWAFFKKSLLPNSSESVKKIITQVFIAVILIAGTGSIIDTLFDLSEQTYTSVTGENSKNDLAMTLIKDNTTDLFKVADNGWKSDKTNQNSLSKNNFESSDMSSIISYKKAKDLSTDNKEMTNLMYRINYDTNGNQIATKIEDDQGFIKVFDPGYARYSAKGIVLIPGLMALAVAKAFILFMTISTILSIGIASLIAPIVYATDLESGKHTKEVVSDILKMIILIAALGIEYKFYVIALSYIADKLTDPLLYILGLIAATTLLLFGSQKFLKYFGVDTSIKGSGAGLFKAAAGTALATRLVKNAGARGKAGVDGIKSFKERNSGASSLSNIGATTGNSGVGTKGLSDGVSSLGGTNDVTKPGRANMPQKLANAAGYMGVRGVGGAVQDGTDVAKEKVVDTSKAVVEGVKEKASDIKDKMGGAIDGVKEAYKSGQNTGVDKYSQHMGNTGIDKTPSGSATTTPSTGGTLSENGTTHEQAPTSGTNIPRTPGIDSPKAPDSGSKSNIGKMANTSKQMTNDLPSDSRGSAAEAHDQQTTLPNPNEQAADNKVGSEAQDTSTPVSPNTPNTDSEAANDKQVARQRDLNEVVNKETPATHSTTAANGQPKQSPSVASQEMKSRQQTAKTPVPKKAPKTKAEVQRRLEEMNRG